MSVIILNTNVIDLTLTFFFKLKIVAAQDQSLLTTTTTIKNKYISCSNNLVNGNNTEYQTNRLNLNKLILLI